MNVPATVLYDDDFSEQITAYNYIAKYVIACSSL